MSLLGTLLKNRYRVLLELGHGAFGQTFVVEDIDLPSRKCCVLKQLKSIADRDQYKLVQERFEREAAILEKLGEESNGQIPRLYAYFSDGGGFYLVQELVEGQTLKQKMTHEGPLTEVEMKEILVSILPVLDYVHFHGIIHRDIKPDNIMLRQRDQKPVLIDFGIVKEVMQGESQVASTIVAGTPAYMSLEQAAGRPVFSSDLFSLGMTAICLLTGKVPQMMSDSVTGEIQWQRHAPGVSSGLAMVLNKAIEPHVRDRYKTVQEMLEALELSTRIAVPVPSSDSEIGSLSTVIHQKHQTPAKGIPKTDIEAFETIVLGQGAPPAPSAPVMQPMGSDPVELAFWDSIKNSTNLKSFEAYLGKYPNGQFVQLAGIKLEELNPDPVGTGSGPPLQTFDCDTVLLDAEGFEVERRSVSARYFSDDLGGGIKLDMVAIPGGSFQMGSGEIESERPPHRVNVSPFFMGKYMVTQAQWELVAGWPKVNMDLKPDPAFNKDDNRPVEMVSWNEAIEFCTRLSERTGKPYRLPSEAEWEYACRAGTATPFAFGETVKPEVVNYDGNFPFGAARKGKYRKETTLVGYLGVANHFGLFDMHGNLWEWCQDLWHPNYGGAPIDGSAWDTGNETKRVLRGGSWINNAWDCRSSNRTFCAPMIHNAYNGLRLVLVDERLTDSQPGVKAAKPLPPPPQPEVAKIQPASSPAPALRKGELPKLLAINLGRDVKMDFVLITPGAFQMGSNDYDNEKPVHRVNIGYSFYLGKYLVTQVQWQTVMGRNPSNFKTDVRPVENVSWDMAQEFLAKLNAGKEGYLYRLPTEAEWEFACRAGATGNFCFGDGKNLLKEYAWFDENSKDTTQPVGQKKPNVWGLYDMHGNVYEWCQDWYHDNYSGAPTDGSEWVEGSDNKFRVLRGGSWPYYASYCRAPFRYRAAPGAKKSNYGMRVLITVG